MDALQYEQYCYVIKNGTLSLDALKRIIKHDHVSGWSSTPGGLARIKVAEDCDKGLIAVGKLMDDKGDYLYGNGWPLPLTFVDKNVKEERCCNCDY